VAGKPRPVPQRHDFTELVGRVSALRKRTAAAAARLAETEQQVARTQDGLAFRDPGNPEHKRRADQAREALGRAREIERKYSGSWPGDFWITPGVMPGKVICGTLGGERGRLGW
jgi:hypothetical protein